MLTDCRVVTDREVVGHLRHHVFDAALDDMAAGFETERSTTCTHSARVPGAPGS